jgi:hypothetical protein
MGDLRIDNKRKWLLDLETHYQNLMDQDAGALLNHQLQTIIDRLNEFIKENQDEKAAIEEVVATIPDLPDIPPTGNMTGHIVTVYDTGSGVWTKHEKTYKVTVIIIGGGGNGGKGGTSTLNPNGGGGGGGGAYLRVELAAATLGSTMSYTVGYGGATDGDAGQPSSFAGYMAYGGGGGWNNPSEVQGSGGGGGGTGSVGETGLGGGAAQGGTPDVFPTDLAVICGEGARGGYGAFVGIAECGGGGGGAHGRGASDATDGGSSLYGGGGGGGGGQYYVSYRAGGAGGKSGVFQSSLKNGDTNQSGHSGDGGDGGAAQITTGAPGLAGEWPGGGGGGGGGARGAVPNSGGSGGAGRNGMVLIVEHLYEMVNV